MKVLILTDHRSHRADNSLYSIARELKQHTAVKTVAVATRGNSLNDDFFYHFSSKALQVSMVSQEFDFTDDGSYFHPTQQVEVHQFDWIILRLPRPIPEGFFEFLISVFPDKKIVNRPSGILTTSSKAFLLEVPELCPKIQLVKNLEEVDNFRKQYSSSVVLKPLLNYGGRGIIKLSKDMVWEGNQAIPFQHWKEKTDFQNFEYLAMEYLEQVHLGDKRIVVCNGKVILAALRFPASGSWICNVAQGGHAENSVPDKDELKIIEKVDPILQKHGILLYGIDTLMGNQGKRVLSELNTLSIGGIAPSGALATSQVVQEFINYFKQNQGL